MKFCTDHWGKLRQAVKDRGLDALVADSGEQAVSNLASELADGTTIDNFDPLMSAHVAIASEAMTTIRDFYHQNPLMVMADPVDHPEWACPICALNWCHVDHAQQCTRVGCDWPKQHDWTDEMVNGGADFVLAQWKKLAT